MYPSYIFALTGLIATAVAETEIEIENGLFEIGFAVDNHQHEADLEKRKGYKRRCSKSVISSLMPAMPTNTAFSSWIKSASADHVDTETCTVTVPSSFSDDYLNYYSTLTDWFSTVADDAATADDCFKHGKLSMTVTSLCSTSRTVI